MLESSTFVSEIYCSSCRVTQRVQTPNALAKPIPEGAAVGRAVSAPFEEEKGSGFVGFDCSLALPTSWWPLALAREKFVRQEE